VARNILFIWRMKLKTFKVLAAVLPVVISLSSCSLGIKSTITKNYPALNPTDSVQVIPLHAAIPANAEQLGTVRIYDAGTFNCGYDVVMDAAKAEARKAGGNALKIIEHYPPSVWSTCHQVIAMILRFDATAIPGDTLQQKNTNTSSPTVATGTATSVKQEKAKNNKPYKAFYMGAEGGWSWRINKLDPNLNSFQKEYMKGLRSGHHYGFSAVYYVSRGIGIGLMYDNHISKNSVQASAINNITGQILSGELRDDISINFIGASVDFRGISRSGNNSSHFKISLGYCGYKDEGGFIDYGKITGSTFGISYDISYDFKLVDQWYFSPSVAYRAGTLTSYDITINNNTQHVTLDKEEYQGMSRIDLSAGLRYKW
jgi:hypothetical protein